jgi:hypothetical protein
MQLIMIAVFAATAAIAQTAPSRRPATDAEKIADALRAGPPFVTKGATLLDWPSTPGGEYRVLRKGSTPWTCLPGDPGFPHDEPACFDPEFLRWVQDSRAGHTSRIDQIAIAYMYAGAWVKAVKGGSANHEFHVGPHLMVIGPHQDEFQGVNRDGSTGMPYVTHLPDRTELFLVMPIRQWDER